MTLGVLGSVAFGGVAPGLRRVVARLVARRRRRLRHLHLALTDRRERGGILSCRPHRRNLGPNGLDLREDPLSGELVHRVDLQR